MPHAPSLFFALVAQTELLALLVLHARNIQLDGVNAKGVSPLYLAVQLRQVGGVWVPQ
jgi:hypothetical protein